MNTRFKHLSKTTISVLLSLLMIVSTVTVGIVATNAAYTDDEAVGYDSFAVHYQRYDGDTDWTDTSLVSSGGKVTVDANSWLTGSNHQMKFDVKANSDYCKDNQTFNDGDTKNLSTSGSADAKVNVTKRYVTFTVGHQSDNSVWVKVTMSDTNPADAVFLFGYVNGSDVSEDSTAYEFTQSSSDSNVYTLKFTPTSDIYAQINSKGTKYKKDYDEAAEGTEYLMSTSATNKVGIKGQSGTEIILTWNASTHKLKWDKAVVNRTVTYGVQTASSSYGTVTATRSGTTTSIGSSPATVANNTSVTFTATPNFGYEFVGWYTTQTGNTAHAYGNTNPKTASITSNETVYARFQACTPDGYYLGGRFATATSAANIHSNTTAATREQYGQSVADGGGIDKKTGYNYWSWNEGSTNIKFTESGSNAEGSRTFYLNTYRTVKQLSEDKDKLYGDYGGTRDTYHDPFYYIIHDKVHRLGGTDSSGINFQNQNSESNALSLAEYTGVVKESNEIRFNNYNSQSNGWVKIWLKENGYKPSTGSGGTPTIWYEIIDETPPAAGTVRISATPARIDRNATGNNVTLKGSYVADTRNAPANTITYTFYKSTDGKNWTQIGTADSTSDTYSYRETSTASAMYYKVTVGSNTTTAGGLDYDTRSATTSVEIYASGLYMSYNISGTSNPSWSGNLVSYATSNTPYKRETSSSYTNNNPYTFALSTEAGWDPDMPKYDIDEASNQFCTIEYEIKDVTIGDTSESVVTYKVIPNPKCSNPTIYVDFKNKKVWAIASYTPSAKGTINNYGSEKVTYYFAEADYCTDKSNPTSGTGMRIHYWNNSNPSGLNGTTNVTTAVNVAGKNTSGTAQTNNSIYVSRKDLFGTDFINNNKQRFYVYSVELPIWATSFQFLSSSSTDSFGVQPTYTNSVDDSKNHSITLNPNRIYVLYEWNNKYYVKGVVLDESMWNGSRTTDGNEVSTFKVDTNVIKYKNLNRLNTPYDPNHNLSSAYSAYTTPNALYFGYLENSNGEAKTGQTGCTVDYNSWGASDLFYNLSKTSPKQWAANLAQRKVDPNSYYASVQELVGMTTSKTKFNTNGDGNTFGYLMDTKGNDSTTGKSTANNFPLFAYEGDGTRGSISSYSATNTVAQGKKFPFYQSTLNGITTYSYDSTTDRNRVYSNNNFSIQGTGTDNGFATGKDADNNQYVGLFPWGGNNDSYGGCAFGIEFDLNFYMSNTGYLTDKNGNAQDIAFNFSGDDDVWVFVDGVKVLDLGGDHKVSAATINFTDGKVYYKSSANSINSSLITSQGAKGDWAAGDNSYINVVDLNELLAAYGKEFKSTDATTKHTFQMFYMERGAFQSNCVISFNLPQAGGLNVKNNITADNVNAVMQKDALYAANPDYFTYKVQARLVNGTLPSEISGQAKAPAETAGSLNFSTPLYPYAYETKRVYDDERNPVITYVLSTSGGSGSAGSRLTYSKTAWTTAANTVYDLSDEHLVATTAGKAQVTGKSDSSGDLHLLSGQMATFNDKIPQNAYVKVYQDKDLGTVNNTSPIAYETVTNNETGSYYITSYSVYDEKAKKYIVNKTTPNINFTSDHPAADSRLSGTDGADGFYFSNYTGDDEDVNSAMRVDFYNDIAVGKIRISKELDDGTYSAAKFKFKVKFGRIFGSGSETLKEYPGLEYKLYNADDTLIGTRYYNSQNGITLTPGQYAEIEGIPVETYYEVEEIPAAGYSFVSLTKTAEKPNGNTVYYIDPSGTTTANDYGQVILAPSASKTTDATITVEDGFKIYKNMIPPVEETFTTGTDYVSLNKIDFINQRESFTITYKYYDRDITNNVPASISNAVSQYSVTLKKLDAYIYNKGDSLDTKYNYLSELPGIDDLENGDFVAYNYEKMVVDKAVEFTENTGTGISNLIDDYTMWTRQDKADSSAGLRSKYYIQEGRNYNASESVYHTSSAGVPNNSGERWVNYLSSDGHELFPENPADKDADFHAGDLSKYENIKSIVVWVFNEPKQYNVNIYGATSASDLQNAANITLAGSGITITGARVAKSSSTSKYSNVKGYYSQRFGDLKGDEYLDTIAYLSVYDIDACVQQNDDYVIPELKASETIGDLQFAYWAYDPEGKQVASTDYHLGNRITGEFNLYAVYASQKLASNQFGLTIVQDADDTFVQNGVARVRINTMFNPYNLPDFDTKIIRAAVVNIYTTKLVRAGYDEDQIKALMELYRGQLKAMLEANSFTPISVTEGGLSVELTTKGYVKLVNSGPSSITLTNKNRIEFTTQFNKDSLYTATGTSIIQLGAMAYDANGDGATLGEWVLSDNMIYRHYPAG